MTALIDIEPTIGIRVAPDAVMADGWLSTASSGWRMDLSGPGQLVTVGEWSFPLGHAVRLALESPGEWVTWSRLHDDGVASAV